MAKGTLIFSNTQIPLSSTVKRYMIMKDRNVVDAPKVDIKDEDYKSHFTQVTELQVKFIQEHQLFFGQQRDFMRAELLQADRINTEYIFIRKGFAQHPELFGSNQLLFNIIAKVIFQQGYRQVLYYFCRAQSFLPLQRHVCQDDYY